MKNTFSYLSLIAGILVLVAGLLFLLIPFIPLGYIFIILGLSILAKKIPFLHKWVRLLKWKRQHFSNYRFNFHFIEEIPFIKPNNKQEGHS